MVIKGYYVPSDRDLFDILRLIKMFSIELQNTLAAVRITDSHFGKTRAIFYTYFPK